MNHNQSFFFFLRIKTLQNARYENLLNDIEIKWLIMRLNDAWDYTRDYIDSKKEIYYVYILFYLLFFFIQLYTSFKISFWSNNNFVWKKSNNPFQYLNINSNHCILNIYNDFIYNILHKLKIFSIIKEHDIDAIW